MTVIGIDPSINSTGVCIDVDGCNKYVLIPSKITRKMSVYKNDKVEIRPYNKSNADKSDTYAIKEMRKTDNIVQIYDIISDIINEYKPDLVRMEGCAYSANGNVVDLGGLNYVIRLLCVKNNIKFEILSPNEVKMKAVGNGKATKDMMVNAWRMVESGIKKESGIKIDDLADSYFIAHV